MVSPGCARSKERWYTPVLCRLQTTQCCHDQRLTSLFLGSDDTLDRLSGAQMFSTIDLTAGYWQFRLTQQTKKKQAFRQAQGLYISFV